METRYGASLHNHSYFSLLDAICSPEDLVKQAAEMGYKMFALTDHGVNHGFIRAYKAALEHGIKFAPGVEAYETTDMDYKEKDAPRYHLILIAKTNNGLKNLHKIVTESHLRGFYGKPRVDLELLRKYGEDIICSSACLASKLSRTLVSSRCACCPDGIHLETFEPKWELAKKYVEEYKSIFGNNFYIELQAHRTFDQKRANQLLLRLARETNTRFVITTDSHMLNEDQIDIHRKFIQIAQDRELDDYDTYLDCWQMPLDKIREIMYPQIGEEATEEAIKTTDDIAEQVNVIIELHQNLMPHISIPEEFESELDYLKSEINKGWIKRGLHKLPKEQREIYKERLRNELEVIEYLDYASYFLLLKQFVDKVREREIPMGYGRGSAGGCLILYVLGVTEIDSIRWNLDFSRFANKGRKGSPADVDMDISKRRRQEAIEIMVELFGRENISNLATFNSLSPKVCIRDLGKVFHEEGIYNLPYATRDAISKLIPDDPNQHMTIEKALESSAELRRYAEMYPMLFEYTKVLQNIPKSVGCHASAIIVGKEPVINYAPLMYNKEGSVMLQLEMHDAQDELGLIKVDVLGLKSMDVVKDTLDFAGLSWKDIDIKKLNFEDHNVLKDIYEDGNTLGIFQMESKVCQDMFRDIKPDTVEDVIAVAALNRPAVLSVGMDKEYIYGKHNKEETLNNLIHPDLKPIFEPTNSIMLYQEQALQVFGLAGFDEAKRDVARRAIGKKKADVMESLYKDFSEGLKARGWTEDQIEAIWELVEAQSGYSFNRAHSVSYGVLSYVMAYLKRYYPVEFMTALLTSEIGNYQETSKYINECKRMGIEVLPPDINKSQKDYSIVDGKILFGLGAIKGVGENAAEKIIQIRNEVGGFKSFQDFVEKVKIDTEKVTNLVKSGVFSAFSTSKIELLSEYGKMLFEYREYKPVRTLPPKKKLIEMGIFGENKEELLEKYNERRRILHEEAQRERFNKHMEEFKEKYMSNPDMFEYSTLNIFLVDPNPFEIAEQLIKPFDEYPEGGKAVVGGTITGIKYGKQKNGARYARFEILTFNSGMLEGITFNKQYVQFQNLIKKGTNVVILARKSEGQFMVEDMKTLEQWKKDMAHRLKKKAVGA